MSRPVVISSDSHVFEPPDLWTTRIDSEFKERAPHMRHVDGLDRLFVEGDQFLAGIGLISGAGMRFRKIPRTSSTRARFEDVHVGGYEPGEHIRDMKTDGVSAENPLPLPRPLLLQGAGLGTAVGNFPRLQRLGWWISAAPTPSSSRASP